MTSASNQWLFSAFPRRADETTQPFQADSWPSLALDCPADYNLKHRYARRPWPMSVTLERLRNEMPDRFDSRFDVRWCLFR